MPSGACVGRFRGIPVDFFTARVPSLFKCRTPPMFETLRTHPWAYPALEVVHLLGLALLIGSLLLFELRVWGFGPALPVKPLARLALRVSLVGFALAACSGLLMLASQWGELRNHVVFLSKMGLVVLAGVNAAAFHLRGGVARLDGWARAQTALSLGLWIAVVACGRFIDYV
jgi:hypothetical protein